MLKKLCQTLYVETNFYYARSRDVEKDLMKDNHIVTTCSGFGLGADDYIKKPFGMDELSARVNAHLRREKRIHHSTIQSGNIRFDLSGMKLMVQDEMIFLTKGEYQICEFLVKNKGQVF